MIGDGATRGTGYTAYTLQLRAYTSLRCTCAVQYNSANRARAERTNHVHDFVIDKQTRKNLETRPSHAWSHDLDDRSTQPVRLARLIESMNERIARQAVESIGPL